MQRTLESRIFIPAILAMVAGTFLFYAHPFPDQQIFLNLIALRALRAPRAFLSFKYLYYALLFTTPYLVCSAAFSGLYIFTLKAGRTIADSLNVVIHVDRPPGRRYISEVLLINRYDPDADLFDYGAVFLAKKGHP
jgi:hypothetical protein